MSGHFKIVCPKCETVLSQCRCPDLNKDTRYMLCTDCIAAQKETIG